MVNTHGVGMLWSYTSGVTLRLSSPVSAFSLLNGEERFFWFVFFPCSGTRSRSSYSARPWSGRHCRHCGRCYSHRPDHH